MMEGPPRTDAAVGARKSHTVTLWAAGHRYAEAASLSAPC